MAAVVNDANVTGRNFISVVESIATLPGNKYFGFAGGVVDGGIPSEIMYNDIDGYLTLPHSSAQQVTQAYADITQPPYGVYLDSNNGAPADRFPVTAGTVYVFRSIMPFGATATYYKLEIVSATQRTDVNSTDYGVVTFKYAPILTLDIEDAVGRWVFPDNSELAILSSTLIMDYDTADAVLYSFSGDYTDHSTLVGHFETWTPVTTSGAVTVTLAVTTDGTLNATITGDAPLGSVTLTGGVKQP